MAVSLLLVATSMVLTLLDLYGRNRSSWRWIGSWTLLTGCLIIVVALVYRLAKERKRPGRDAEDPSTSMPRRDPGRNGEA